MVYQLLVPPQSLTFSIDGQEVEVTERAYSDLLNENKGLREELDSLRSGESEERDARDARVRWVQDDRAGALDIVFRQVFLSQPRHKDVSRAVTYPEPLPSPA